MDDWIPENGKTLQENYKNIWEALGDYEPLQEKLSEIDSMDDKADFLISVGRNVYEGKDIDEVFSVEDYVSSGVQKKLNPPIDEIHEQKGVYLDIDLLRSINYKIKDEVEDYEITLNDYTGSRVGSVFDERAEVGNIGITSEESKVNSYDLFKDVARRLEAKDRLNRVQSLENQKENLQGLVKELEEKKERKDRIKEEWEKRIKQVEENPDVYDTDPEKMKTKMEKEIESLNEELPEKVNELIGEESIEEKLEEAKDLYDEIESTYSSIANNEGRLDELSEISGAIKNYRNHLFSKGFREYQNSGEIQEGKFEEITLGSFVGLLKDEDNPIDAWEQYKNWNEEKEDYSTSLNSMLVRMAREDSDVADKILTGEMSLDDATDYYGDEARDWVIDSYHDMDLAYTTAEAQSSEFTEEERNIWKIPAAGAGALALIKLLSTVGGAGLDPDEELSGGIGPIPGKVVHTEEIDAELNQTDIIGDISQGSFTSENGSLDLSIVNATGSVDEAEQVLNGSLEGGTSRVLLNETEGMIYLPKGKLEGLYDGNITYSSGNVSEQGEISGNVTWEDNATVEMGEVEGKIERGDREVSFRMDRQNNSLIINDGELEGEYQGIEVDDFVAKLEAKLKDTKLSGKTINDDPIWSDVAMYGLYGLLGGAGVEYTRGKLNKKYEDLRKEQDRQTKLEAAETEASRAQSKRHKYSNLEKEELPEGDILKDLEKASK